ncbi:MAG: hypothetical protein ACLGHX_06515 [Acidimicrobiia bacterium]
MTDNPKRKKIEQRRRGRVVASHRIAVNAFRVAGFFLLVAISWAGWVAIRGGSWWGPTHTFLLGTVSLAISGAAQMFTITWSAAPAPSALTATAQRWSIAGGAMAVLVGVSQDRVALTVVGALAVIVGILLLGHSLIDAVRHSLLRRFDLSARFYLLAIGCAVVGVSLGLLLGTGWVGDSYTRVRVVHGHLNLIGFIGFTIVGTLPTILPTFAHHHAVSGREAIWGWRLAVIAAAAILSGVVLGERAVGVGTLLAATSLLAVLGGVVVRLAETGPRGGLPYLQVSLGSMWLAVWAVVDGARLLVDGPGAAFDRWIAAAVLAGVGQVLLGSLAYLVPVLAGPGPRLARNFESFERRRWLPLIAANAIPFGLIGGVPAVAATAATLWVLDFGARLVRLDRADGQGLPTVD